MGALGRLHRWVRGLKDNPFLLIAGRKEERLSPGRRFLQRYGAYLTLLFAPLMLTVIACNRFDGQNLAVLLPPVAALLAFLQILYVAVRACTGTSSCLVGERQGGTLMALALTRLDSADYADGVAAANAAPILRELLVLLPVPAVVGLLAGADVYAVLMLWAISSLVAIIFSYQGVLISATSASSSQASTRALTQPLMLLLLTPLLFVFGGFLAYPLWIVHPYAALALAIWGSPSLQGLEHVLVLRWLALLFVPAYLMLIREVRARTISALERVSLT